MTILPFAIRIIFDLICLSIFMVFVAMTYTAIGA